MKTLIATLLVAGFSLISMHASAAGCGSKTTSCYDYCKSGYVPVAGDQCDTEYDYSRGCYKAVGKCSSSGETGNKRCEGQSISCYDYCSSRYIRVEDANGCESAYDYTRSCYAAVGTCN